MTGKSFRDRLEQPYEELYGLVVLHPELFSRIVRGPKPSLWRRLSVFMEEQFPEILLWWLLFFTLALMIAG